MEWLMETRRLDGRPGTRRSPGVCRRVRSAVVRCVWRCTVRCAVRCVGLAVCACVCMAAHAAKKPKAQKELKVVKPSVTLPLAADGYAGYSAALQGLDVALVTANFVDRTHALVTFHARTLITRSKEDKVDDQTRNIDALLVELPSGRVLARAEWHVFDYGRYLWALGDGRFLLRIRNSLRVLDPMAGLAAGNAFEQQPLLKETEPLIGVDASPLSHVLVTQTGNLTATGDPAKPAAGTASSLLSIAFMRLIVNASHGLTPVLEMRATADAPIQVALDDAGYLLPEDQDFGDWKVSFTAFGGAVKPLADLTSSCPPLLGFTGPATYVALSCRGQQDKLTLLSFDFSGHEVWEETFADQSHTFTFAYAPAVARFAVSRILPGGVRTDATGESKSVPDAQDVRVYGSLSGDLLAQARIPTAFQQQQNFDVSADGTALLVLNASALEVYDLAPVSKQDSADVAYLATLAPPVSDGPINFARIEKKVAAADAATAAVQSQSARQNGLPPQAQAGGITSSEIAVAPVTQPVSDAKVSSPGDDSAPRKVPTLLDPGEKPEFGKANPR
jgi:hypothetical protein